MVGGMGGEADEGVLQAWGKCFAGIALSDEQHPAGELPQACGQFLEMVVFAGDDPCGGQGKERFADGDIDMHGSPAVVTGLQQGLVDEAVAMPFVFLALHFGQADGFPDQRAKHAGLGQGLPVHLAYPGGGAVGRDDHQRHLAVEGFGHGGMQIEQGGAGGAADSDRPPVVQGESQGKEARTALVGHGIASELVLHRREGAHQGDITAARTKYDFPDAVRRQQSGQLKDVFLICEHGG